MHESDRAFEKKRLKITVGRSRELVFHRAREKTTDFAKPLRVMAESTSIVSA